MITDKPRRKNLSSFGKQFAIIAAVVLALMFVAIAQDKALWVVLAVGGCSALAALVAVGDWRGWFD